MAGPTTPVGSPGRHPAWRPKPPATGPDISRLRGLYEIRVAMKAVVEPLEGNKVKLSVEVDEQEFEKAIDAAFRKIAREVRIPGFRPGKAPRRILEARLGKETGRSEALRDALPDYYSQALRDHDVDAIAPPEIDITAGREAGPLTFDAVVEVRPQLQLAGYEGLRVEIPSPTVSAEEIDAQVDRLRGNFAQLAEVGRPARDGDNLTIDLKGTRDGQDVPGLTINDFLYELGSGTVLPELDVRLQGGRPGDILAFDADLPDGPVALKLLVKDVKEKVLPEVTDEWASESSEFDTVAELRADIEKQVGLVKRVQAAMALRNGALEALVELVDGDPPPALVDSEVERRVHDLQHRLEAQRATVEQYLEAIGQTPEQFSGRPAGGRGHRRQGGPGPASGRRGGAASSQRTRTSTPRSSAWPSPSRSSPDELRKNLEQRGPDARGTLRLEEKQSLGMACRPRGTGGPRRPAHRPRSPRTRS